MKFQLISITILFLLLTSVYAFSQRGKAERAPENVLIDTNWQVDGVPFEDEKREEYTFGKIDSLDYGYHWGHFISFTRSTFSSHYSAPCGNDCFTSVNGEYFFVDELKVQIKVLTIDRHGFCQRQSEKVNHNYGIYNLIKVENGWKISKAV